MVMIATHKEKGGRFVVIGASLSKWKTSRGSAILGDLAPVEKEGNVRVLTVCGADGVLQFANADDMRIVEIDGKPVAAVLTPA